MRRVVLEPPRGRRSVSWSVTFTLADLERADEVFVTNALFGIWPVARLDERDSSGTADRRALQLLGYGHDA